MTHDPSPRRFSLGRVALAAALGAGLLIGGYAVAQSQAKQMVGHIVEPERRPLTFESLRALQAPAGFTVGVYADGLNRPRMLAVAADGTVYATRRETNDVVALNDRDGDGRADELRVVVGNLPGVHGIALHQGRLYLVTIKELYVADRRPDGALGELRMLLNDLPDAGQHPNRTLAFGPDGMLYVTVGSTCNACDDPNKETATILRMAADGSGRTVHASGLRNTIGFGWQPDSGELWGMDHGSDWRGDDQPPEELNRIQAGGNYGWPFCYADRRVDEFLSADPPGLTKAEYCAGTLPPALTYQAHSAPIGMVFYTGDQFPAEYRGDAFVAMRGSWNRQPPSGYKLVRVRFRDGQPAGIEDFVTGFLIDGGAAHIARLAGVAVMPDGSLLVSDDTNGVVYRVAYTGGS